MATFDDLKLNSKKDFSTFRRVRLGILGDSATQALAQALRGEGYDRRLDLAIDEGPYGQIEAQIVDPALEFVVVYQAVEKLLARFQRTAPAERERFAEDHLGSIARLTTGIAGRSAARVLVFNWPELDDGVFGSFANKTARSFLYQLRKMNTGLMDLARADKGLFVVDVSLLAAEHGRATVSDPRIAVRTDLLFAFEFLPHVARSTLDVVDAALGRFKKALVLDLDNTLWGGLIGDDGIEGIELGDLGLGEAYSQVQAWAKQLRERGVILAVCSKNDAQVAREPFEKHPDMLLRLDDIAVFHASWENKADGLRHIQSILEIGFESMVFVDDNPVEREQVHRAIPDLCVPELPDDPALVAPFLRSLNLFETVSLTEEDALRTQQYQDESKRRTLQSSFADEGEFLRSLEMVATVEGFTDFNTPRVAQLTQRSNQFNLRTVRYSEEEIARIGRSAEHVPFAISLTDRFGAYGLVNVIILKKMGDVLFVDTWLMSCRVLKRGLEGLALNALVEAATREGFRRLVGEYLPTKKNALVKDHYASLGFRQAPTGSWELDVGEAVPRIHYIRES